MKALAIVMVPLALAFGVLYGQAHPPTQSLPRVYDSGPYQCIVMQGTGMWCDIRPEGMRAVFDNLELYEACDLAAMYGEMQKAKDMQEAWSQKD